MACLDPAYRSLKAGKTSRHGNFERQKGSEKERCKYAVLRTPYSYRTAEYVFKRVHFRLWGVEGVEGAAVAVRVPKRVHRPQVDFQEER
jgi:hypothetical protein